MLIKITPWWFYGIFCDIKEPYKIEFMLPTLVQVHSVVRTVLIFLMQTVREKYITFSHVPSWTSLPPSTHPTHLGNHRAPSYQSFPISVRQKLHSCAESAVSSALSRGGQSLNSSKPLGQLPPVMHSLSTYPGVPHKHRLVLLACTWEKVMYFSRTVCMRKINTVLTTEWTWTSVGSMNSIL